MRKQNPATAFTSHRPRAPRPHIRTVPAGISRGRDGPSSSVRAHPRIRDPVLEELSQRSPIKLAEEIADVRVEHPVHLLAVQTDRERVQCVVRGTPRAESVGETTEVRLVDRAPHPGRRPAEGCCPPTRRCRAVGAARPSSGCPPAWSAWPGSAQPAAARAGPGGCPPGPARGPPTSSCPPPARRSHLIARYESGAGQRPPGATAR